MDFYIIIAIVLAILTVLMLKKKRVIKDPFETKEMQVEIDFGKQKLNRPFLVGDYVGKEVEVKNQKGIITKIFYEGTGEEEEQENKYKKWL